MDTKRKLAIEMLEQKLIESREGHAQYIIDIDVKLAALEAFAQGGASLDVAPEHFRDALEQIEVISGRIENSVGKGGHAHRILDKPEHFLAPIRARTA